MIVLRAFGADDAFITGFATGHRNVGLMAAAQSGSLPELTWLYFALVQLPIYLTPLIIQVLLARKAPARTKADADRDVGVQPK
jgi:BASS family bile acid:Na+ symporter